MFELTEQGQLLLEELSLAFALSALIGLARDMRQSGPGLRVCPGPRVCTVAGVSSALFALVCKDGFMAPLDDSFGLTAPSHVAAQLLAGLCVMGGGLFVARPDIVRSLMPPAAVWPAAAVGIACGGGLRVAAVAITIGHVMIKLIFPKVLGYLSGRRRTATRLRVAYEDGRGLLRMILVACTDLRFVIGLVDVERDRAAAAAARDVAADPGAPARQGCDAPRRRVVVLRMQVRGRQPVAALISRLGSIDGVVRVGTMEDDIVA